MNPVAQSIEEYLSAPTPPGWPARLLKEALAEIQRLEAELKQVSDLTERTYDTC